MSDERPPADDLFERVLDLAVYAPVGFVLAVRDELPGRVRQGRQAMENRVQLARFIGQLAVQTGQRELARRVEQRRAATPSRHATAGPGEAPAADAGAPGPSAGHGEVRTAHDPEPIDVRPDVDAAAVPTVDELPITDYESLAAIHVVDRLRTMQPDELDLVRRFEVAHRNRRTIIAKIDQLQAR